MKISIYQEKKRFAVEKEGQMKTIKTLPPSGKKVKGKMLKSYQTPQGTLYKDEIINIEYIEELKTRVSNSVGRIFWIKSSDVQVD